MRVRGAHTSEADTHSQNSQVRRMSGGSPTERAPYISIMVVRIQGWFRGDPADNFTMHVTGSVRSLL